MRGVGRFAAVIARHRVAAEVGAGAGLGFVLGLGTAWQDGFTSEADLRGMTLGIASGWAIWFLARRRRIETRGSDPRTR